MFYNTLEQFNIMMEIAKIIKNNISLDIGKTFSQTDQKKQPCLAAKACQLRTKFQFCFRQNLQNWNQFMLH